MKRYSDCTYIFNSLNISKISFVYFRKYFGSWSVCGCRQTMRGKRIFTASMNFCIFTCRNSPSQENLELKNHYFKYYMESISSVWFKLLIYIILFPRKVGGSGGGERRVLTGEERGGAFIPSSPFYGHLPISCSNFPANRFITLLHFDLSFLVSIKYGFISVGQEACGADDDAHEAINWKHSIYRVSPKKNSFLIENPQCNPYNNFSLIDHCKISQRYTLLQLLRPLHFSNQIFRVFQHLIEWLICIHSGKKN